MLIWAAFVHFLALIIPVLSFTRKYIYYEILFFLILAGTLQSLITPSEYNFLNFTFFRYWFVHSGLVIFMLYVLTKGFGYQGVTYMLLVGIAVNAIAGVGIGPVK